MNEINKIVEAYNWANLDERIVYLLDGVVERETKQIYVKNHIEELVRYLDYTTLRVTDNREGVTRFIAELDKRIEKNRLESVAGICVYPNHVATVKELVSDSMVRCCCVAGAFPASQSFIEVKELECRMAVAAGADEIDVVLNVGEMVAGNDEAVYEELKRLRTACKGVVMKVILECGELKSSEMIFHAALLAMHAGADFIKSSTGKVPVNATGESVYMMCEAARLYHEVFGRRIGIKVSGGIGKAMSALRYRTLVKLILGDEWLTPSLFRIGGSVLLDDVIREVRFFDEA